VETLDEKAPEP
jgi:hypothetical protein